jgi:tRNA U34 2-thiouridine synthase MnmA/TrmU
VEPISNLSTERIQQLAKEQNLQVKPQKDGRLIVYGQPESIKEFLKKMTTATAGN